MRSANSGGPVVRALLGTLCATVGAAVLPLVLASPAAAAPTLTVSRTIQTNPFVGTTTRMRDGEGGTYVPSDDSLWLVEDVSNQAYEVSRTSGALRGVITKSQFAAAIQLGGTNAAGPNRAADLESMAYDAATDTLYVFSGSCCTSTVLPTAYRLRRGSNGRFAVESFQPLPSGSDFTGASWNATDQKLYVGVSGNLRPYDYVTNTVGGTFRITGLTGIYGLDFTSNGTELFVVGTNAKLYRVDWTTRTIESGWVIDLLPFGIRDPRAVEAVGNQVFVLDGYDGRSSSDPLKYAVYALDLPSSTVVSPVASFSASPTTGTAPLAVTFTDTSTNTPTSWAWNFGDTTTSTLRNPTHSYLNPGTYTVSLTASNTAGGNTSTRTDLIVVNTPTLPDTTITSSPTALTNSSTATFAFTSSLAPATFSCTLDAGAATPCTTPLTVSGLVAGSHQFSVRASTAAGADPTPATWTWSIDLTAPTVSSTDPASGAVGVALGASPTAQFSEPLDPTSITGSTFSLQRSSDGAPVPATVTYDAALRRATLDPNSNLAAGTSYTAALTTAIHDTAGNALASTPSWSFTTATTAPAGIVRESQSSVENTVAVAVVTIPTPAGTQAGDVLVASLSLNGGTVAPPGVPAGWQLIAAVTSITNPRVYGYYRVAGASEPASHSWTLTGAVANGGGIARYSGVNTVTPLDTAASVATGASATSGVIPGVTTVTSGAMLVGAIAINSGSISVTIASPAGMTQAWDIGGKRQELADGGAPAVGPSGTRTWLFSASREWAGWLVALRPA